MLLDMHDSIKAVKVLSPAAVGSSGTGRTSGAIDLAGYQGCELIVSYGAVTSATGVFTLLVTESAASTGGFTSVADGDLLGTELLAGLAAATRSTGTTMSITKRLGYRGSKRYIKAKLSAQGTAGAPCGIDAILFNPRVAPISNP